MSTVRSSLDNAVPSTVQYHFKVWFLIIKHCCPRKRAYQKHRTAKTGAGRRGWEMGWELGDGGDGAEKQGWELGEGVEGGR